MGLSKRNRVIAAVAVAWTCQLLAPRSAAAASQRSFKSPEEAVEALAGAASAGDPEQLLGLFGPQGAKVISSGDPVADRQARDAFVASYAKSHRLVRESDSKAVLMIGEDPWAFPIPLVRQGTAWRFDTQAGAQEILSRRIGRNELSAMQVCLAFVDAQREYASKERGGSGLLEYAQRLLSSPGEQDGLYWQTGPGEEPSPMGSLVASARAEGYGGKPAPDQAPYHGYYYRILKGQGKDAPGGAHDYVVQGHMIGGFALLAFPAKYGDSGIMSFIVNHEGVVYEKDLGSATASVARRITRFDPGSGWKPAQGGAGPPGRAASLRGAGSGSPGDNAAP